MIKYRFRTKEEFREIGRWHSGGYPIGWNDDREMNKYLGQPIPEEFNSRCDGNYDFHFDRWSFRENNYVLISNEPTYEIY